MKALTVCQPWAWAILHGGKSIENRSRRFHHRGPLLIHAGKSRLWLGSEGRQLPGLPPYDQLVYGCLVGQVEVTDCVPVSHVEDQPFASGPWCLILANPRPFLKPIPYRGSQGLFDVPDALISDLAHLPLDSD